MDMCANADLWGGKGERKELPGHRPGRPEARASTSGAAIGQRSGRARARISTTSGLGGTPRRFSRAAPRLLYEPSAVPRVRSLTRHTLRPSKATIRSAWCGCLSRHSARTACAGEAATFARFLAMTAQTIVDTVTEMASAQCGESPRQDICNNLIFTNITYYFRAEKIRLRKNEVKDLKILETNDIVEEEEMKSNGNAYRVSLLIVAITVFISFE